MRAIAATLATFLLLAGCVGQPDPEPEPVAPGSTGTPPTPPVQPPPPVAPPPSDPTPPAGDAEKDDPEPAPAPRIDVTRWNETITGAGASPPAGPCCLWRSASGNDDDAFEVPEGAKGLVFEILWDDEVADLDLQLISANYAERIPPEPDTSPSLSEGDVWSNTAGRAGDPDGHATIVVADPALLAAGTWHWRIGLDGPGKDVVFQAVASVFLDAPPADGYSAIVPSDNP